MIPLAPLRTLAAAHARAEAESCCELCTAPIGERHQHVVEVGAAAGARGLLCACESCAILFRNSARDARYRTVPDRLRVDRSAALSPERLGLPVGLVFCVRKSRPERVVARYPGPAGIVDAELPPGAWDAIAAATPLAAILEPDVEALLLRGDRGALSLAWYLVPISTAYELAARLRQTWQGFSGGDAAQQELTRFFAELDVRGENP